MYRELMLKLAAWAFDQAKQPKQPSQTEVLAKAVALHYAADPTTAGLVVAWLPDSLCHYVSICRYHDMYGEGKEVVVKYKHYDLEVCLNEVRQLWLKEIGRSAEYEAAIRELQEGD